VEKAVQAAHGKIIFDKIDISPKKASEHFDLYNCIPLVLDISIVCCEKNFLTLTN
jgi:hypothetical protein